MDAASDPEPIPALAPLEALRPLPASLRPQVDANGDPRLSIPAALFSPQRHPTFRVYDYLGEPVVLDPRWVEDSKGETVYIDHADAAAFREYLRRSLRPILADQRIAPVDRGWAAHRALLHEVAFLYSSPIAQARADALIMIARELGSLILRHGDPDGLFSVVRGDTPYSPVVHAMETAIGAISLAIADGQRGPNFLAMVGTGAVFADVSLLELPAAAREETRSLTPAEIQAIHLHPERALQRMRALGIVAQVAQNAAVAHHERWDGTGYPAGLAGEAIPIEARYVAVADAYSTLTSTRRDTPRLMRAEALDRLASSTGQFDPSIVRHLLRLLAPHRVSTAEDRAGAAARPDTDADRAAAG